MESRRVFAGAIAVAAITVVLAPSRIAHAQQDQEIEVVRLRPNFYVLSGAGSNIAVQTGPDGMVLVDAGSAEHAGRVANALKKISDLPIRYIVNTGAGIDHVGGNAQLAKAGRSIFASGPEPVGGEFARAMTNGFAASILATENVLRKVSAPTGQVSSLPNESWPTETFTDRRRTIFFNHEGIEILRQPAAHSDGDALVYFRASDVIAAGDILDVTRFPQIDPENGGSIQGEIDALNRLIDLSVRPMPLVFQEGGTYIVPGHGHVYSQQETVEYRDMLVIIRDLVRDLMDRGLTLEQVQAASPAKGWEPAFGASSGAWTTRDFVAAIYQSLKNGQGSGKGK
jgi:glyoxylase-like metal-dependent hydrolase (beta-lactamase superfamily II)